MRTVEAAAERIAPVFEQLAGVADRCILGPGEIPCARTSPEDLIDVIRTLRDQRGFTHLTLLTAEELQPPKPADGEQTEAAPPASPAGAREQLPQTGLDMIYGLTRAADGTTIIVRVALEDGSLAVPTLSHIWAGAEQLEREVYDLFGVHFDGHPNLRRIVLRDDFVGHPLRKAFDTNGGVSSEAVVEAVKSPGDAPFEETRRPNSPSEEARLAGDPVLHSERLVLNMGPQHPSMHGVLHLWLALDGEQVMASEPTHGYLHRCIEKLCESLNYKACTALLDRSDYVSGFHTELAHILALEELMGIESTPKADYLRVMLGELVRITSHHTWFAAAGLDTGALTPFLYAFIDREKILDFFEAITGARMMFNYFRPGGVKADMPAGLAEEMKAYLKTFDKQVDECESLLTGNEIFRARTRGVGLLSPQAVIDHCVTGPMARASGIDIDLRRDEPYAAYDRIPVNVATAMVGDTFDRYTVRVAEMRESARIALAALEGMPEGPCVNPDVPRAIKPPPGAAYRRVESPRGELGVYLVSDGSAQPWRLKVRSPAFSNLHSAPTLLNGGRIGDVVAVLGSVDVVMGEIDR
ncbi:MAG: NADH-quinone oxidoreductase subunit D [Coriobacteriales bacterium]|nr:NADH-quinone oxidoreductase subunit D [Coriobacteriales bacterium]